MFKAYLVKHKIMKTCGFCGFTYLPMSAYTVHNCPKCSPRPNRMLMETDEDYLKHEIKSTESVSQSMIAYSEPRLVA